MIASFLLSRMFLLILLKEAVVLFVCSLFQGARKYLPWQWEWIACLGDMDKTVNEKVRFSVQNPGMSAILICMFGWLQVGQVCSVSVWSQPWLNSMSVTNAKCLPASSPPASRSKRSVDVSIQWHDEQTTWQFFYSSFLSAKLLHGILFFHFF